MSNVQEHDVKNLLDQKRIAGSLIEYFILEDFGLDIAVFMKWPNNHFTVRFFELKAFVGSSQGGVKFVINKVKGLK